MRFKYYLRGAGIGVIVATLILSVAFLFQDNISDEEVIRRAMKLGMIMEENGPGTLADLQQPDMTAADLESGTDDGQNTDDDALSPDTDTKADDNAGEEPSVSKTDDDGASGNSSDKSSGDKTSDNEASENKTSNDKTSNDKSSNNGTSNDKSSNDKTPDDKSSGDKKPSANKSDGDKSSDNEKPSESDKPSGNGASDDEVIITIESGDVSRMVSAKVFDAGLVESADEFNSYLGAHDYDNKLQPGTHKIPKGADFKKIAQILTTR